ncbi:MAG: GNAT family N-acetyltransferase [Propionibacteriaceae bacterium]|jgi:GNAT superfamily N-acetyltransferase|nr:GNAT family N-acetyltransferase [Propionibacteriaceae bacterium]
MEIRFATTDDIETLVEARLRFNEELHPNAHDENEALAAQFRAYLPTAMKDGSFIGVLGFVEGTLVATVFLAIRDMPANSAMPRGRNGTLLNVFTLPGFRRRGYAERVLAATIDKARELDLDVVDLEATAMGRGLYEKAGFQVRPLTPMRMRLSQ